MVRKRKTETATKEKVSQENDHQNKGTSKLARKAQAQTTVAKKKEGKKGLLRSILVNLGKVLLVVVIVPPFLNYASLQKEKSDLQPEGELYDVGWGQKLFMMCRGQGSPTVILDGPTGMSSDVWTLVWPLVAKTTRNHSLTRMSWTVFAQSPSRVIPLGHGHEYLCYPCSRHEVCIYDRAGLGFSDRPNIQSSNETEEEKTPFIKWQPHTAESMVGDMNHLFTLSSNQPQPFILVGAEMGALIAQFYAQLYEGQIMGLVLVNPLADDIFEQDGGVWIQYWFGQLTPSFQSLQLGAALGLSRLALIFGLIQQPIRASGISDTIVNRQKHLLCNPKHLSSVVDEHHFINETFYQLRLVRKLKALPSNISVTIISGNYYDEQMPSSLNKAWAKSEQNLITKHHPHAKHIVVNGADRHMMYTNPSAIVDPINKLVKKWRHKQKENLR